MILLFVGAGGSFALDPQKFPTTKDFLENHLPSEIASNGWFHLFNQFCQEKKEDGSTTDIEEILTEMETILSHFTDVLDKRKITGWMWSNRERLTNASGLDMSISPSIPDAQYRLETVRNVILKTIHQVYGFESDEVFYHTNLMGLLMKGLIALQSPPVEIFTTNYDRVFEGTIDHDELPIERGWDRKPGPRFVLNLDYWDEPLSSDKMGRLTKLHGSTNWRRVGTEIQSYDGLSGDFSTEDKAILYPGSKGKDSLIPPPFGKFYQHLNVVSLQAKAAIFIGFSFRDSDINRILFQTSSSRLLDGNAIPIFIIDNEGKPTESGPPPAFMGNQPIEYIGTGLTEESVKECLKQIYQKISKSASGS